MGSPTSASGPALDRPRRPRYLRAMSTAEPHGPEATRHTLLEDVQAYLVGTALCALGVVLLQSADLITGQTAGLAVLLSYVSPYGFPLWFFALNAPFYVLGWVRLGPGFVARTLIAVTMVSLLVPILGHAVEVMPRDRWVASFLAGAVTGMGLLAVFRHGASLGGVGILALWMQERFAVRAGLVQLCFDFCLFAAAFVLLPPGPVLASTLGAVVVNLIVAVNHRRDRYVGR